VTGPAFYDMAHRPDFFPAVCSSQGGSLKLLMFTMCILMFINISCKHPRVVKNMLAKYNCSGKCILMRADTVKANFYYP